MIQLVGHLFDPEDRGCCVVTVEGTTIIGISPATTIPAGAVGGPELLLLPGLLDIQVNGAFGDDFADPAADLGRIRRDLTRFGVTGFVPTVVTSPAEAYTPALDHLRRTSGPGEASILGVHIEGPYLAPNRHGTHNPALLRLPDIEQIDGWLEAGDVSYVTLAPELPGATPAIEHLVRNGVRVGLGHTDATWADAEAGVVAGATHVTHLFNAMRPFASRDPGIAGYVLGSHLPAGFIADGHHLAFETIRMLARIKAPDELFLVTDALAGLGMPPGRYRLADREYVSDGTCGRLPDGTLSGSLLPLNLALRNLINEVGLDPSTAVRLATLNPARVLGLEAERGRIAVGRRADLVIVDAAFEVVLTVAGGAVAYRASDAGMPGSRKASS